MSNMRDAVSQTDSGKKKNIRSNGAGWEKRVQPPAPRRYPSMADCSTCKTAKRATKKTRKSKLNIGQKPAGRRR